MVYHGFNYEDNNGKDELPLKIQIHLWQQVCDVVEVFFSQENAQLETVQRGKVCTHLERLILHHRAKELQTTDPELFSEIRAIKRWLFIKGSLPYVIHCTSFILENRHKIAMTDKLSPPFVKLLNSLHWILLESFKECPDATCPPHLSSIELFIQCFIPCIYNLNESDLTINLQNGLMIWQPLWNHVLPKQTLLAIPVFSANAKAMKSSTHSFEDLNMSNHVGVATYFDVALMRVMMVENWNLSGYRWGLQYLQHHLQNILIYQGFDVDNCPILKVMNKFTTRKSISVSKDTRSSNANIMNHDGCENTGENFWQQGTTKIKINETVPENMSSFVEKNGMLKIVFFLDFIKKLVKNKSIYQLSGSLLFVLEQLVEIALDDQHLLKTLITYFQSLLFCQVKIIKMFGCEHSCGIGLKGIKGDHFRYIAHEYLKRLLSADREKAKIWFQNFAENEDLRELLQLLHSMFGFCDSTNTEVEYKEALQQKVYLRSGSNIDEHQLYLQSKYSNEKQIINWVAHAAFKKIAQSWNSDCVNDVEYFSTVAYFARFLQGRYTEIFRKILLEGILNSFVKSPPNAEMVDIQETTEAASPATSSTFSMSTGKTGTQGKTTGKNFKKKLMTMMYQQSVQKEDDSISTLGISPPVNYFSLPRNAQTDNIDVLSKSLPGSFHSSLQEITRESVAGLSEGKQVTIERRNRGRSTKLLGLLNGLKQLRCVLDLVIPGSVPNETIVAALLDLEAPVLSRAAYILELAHFVQRCNKDDWPALITFLRDHSLKGYLQSNTFIKMKQQAGVRFHKWGEAIGRKLYELMGDERDVKEATVFYFLYQGDKDSVSSYAPYSLRYAACQLLKEITAYLRETHLTLLSTLMHSTAEDQQPSHKELREASSIGRRAKKSIVHALSKKMYEGKQRRSSVHPLSTSSNPEGLREPSSPSFSPASTRRIRSPRSPKLARRFSRQMSKTQPDEASYSALMVEEHETSEFPWLDVLIFINKSINLLCLHGLAVCPENCPLQQIKSCKELMNALKLLYESGKEFDFKKQNLLGEKSNVHPIQEYLFDQIGSFYHVPFSALCKGAFVMENPQLKETMIASWEVLLYPDERLKSTAACLFLVAALKMEATVSNFLTSELTCAQVIDRAKAIQRFGVLWDYQNKVYNHLENSTKTALKVPVLKLDYTLPSRMIGQLERAQKLVPGAAWDAEDQMLKDLDLSDDEVTAYFHDSEKRKELKLQKKKKKLNKQKDEFVLLSAPLVYLASLDPWLPDDTEEAQAEQTAVPTSQVSTLTSQQFFPPAMSHGILHLINLLDDTSVTAANSQAVGDVAYQMVWKGMVDDPKIFFRRFFEKITKINKQEELILLLRKLLFHMPKLPGLAAYELFNNLVGVISYYDRTARQGYQERIAELMPLLWQLIPSVPKIYFADMKQSLKREHVDNVFMVTANVGCVKDIVVHGPGKQKESFNITDEMIFNDLLTQMKSVFEVESGNYWLVDKHSGMILENNSKVRDVYVFKRGFPCPVLKLEDLDEDAVASKRQQQAKTGKLLSLSRLELTMSIFDVLPNKKHMMFLYSELCQQASFPRRAIGIEFDLCNLPELGREILALDAIFKDDWIKFISSLLSRLSELHSFGEDIIGLFLDPINGAILLHCEDVMILRTSIAALINVAKSYGKKFSNDGYYDILPTLFRVYSQHENNAMVKQTLEFAFAQFYQLHGNQFILQMLASVSPILMTADMVDQPIDDTSDLIPARCFFALLESLEREIPDNLDVMSLVHGKQPIEHYDTVLHEDEENKIDLAIRLALTIIAYRSESGRALQMMFVLSVIIPFYLKYLESATEARPEDQAPKKREKQQIKNMIKYVATIIEQNEYLVHGYNNEGSINSTDSAVAASSGSLWNKLSSVMGAVRNWFSHASELVQEGDELERTCILDGENPLLIKDTNQEEKKLLEEYYQPRTVLLTLASEFTLHCTERYTILRKDREGRGRSETKFSDIVEEENALILIDVAMALLKLVFFDHAVLQNPGLQKFILDAMPSISWFENLEAFTVIIKRINRIFTKFWNKPEYIKYADWDGLEILIRGIYSTLKRDESAADVQEIRELIHTCTKIMINDYSTSSFEKGTTEISMKSPSSIAFNTTLIKLVAKLLSLRPFDYNIEVNFSCYVKNTDTKKVERFLVHWLLPLCIRMGTGRYDTPTMKPDDIKFAINVLMSLLSPERTLDSTNVKRSFAFITTVTTVGHQVTDTPSMSKICFLGFKILLIFTDAFGKMWKSLKSALIKYMDTYESNQSMWQFISYIVCNRSTILIHLKPVIRKKLSNIAKYPLSIQRICERIKKDLSRPPVISSRSLLLHHLMNELSSLAVSDDFVDVDDEGVNDTDRDGNDVIEEVIQLKSPPTRTPSTEEDDEAYIKRVTTEMRKSGRKRPSSNKSIMKRRTTKKTPATMKEHEPVSKQVSFDQDSGLPEDTSVQQIVVSPRHKTKRTSKRNNKLYMLKRMKSEEEDDKENIIHNEAVNEDDVLQEDDEDGEFSDDSQGKLVVDSSYSPSLQSVEENDKLRARKNLAENRANFIKQSDVAISVADRDLTGVGSSMELEKSKLTNNQVKSEENITEEATNPIEEVSKVLRRKKLHREEAIRSPDNRLSLEIPALAERTSSLSRSPVIRKRHDVTSLKQTTTPNFENKEKLIATMSSPITSAVISTIGNIQETESYIEHNDSSSLENAEEKGDNTTLSAKDDKITEHNRIEMEENLVESNTSTDAILSSAMETLSPRSRRGRPSLPNVNEERLQELKRKISEN